MHESIDDEVFFKYIEYLKLSKSACKYSEAFEITCALKHISLENVNIDVKDRAKMVDSDLSLL